MPGTHERTINILLARFHGLPLGLFIGYWVSKNVGGKNKKTKENKRNTESINSKTKYGENEPENEKYQQIKENK